MKLDLDDPKLTAYALGELSPEERGAIEAALANDPAARAQVDEIRAAGELLTKELAGEAVPGLSPQQKAVIADGAKAPRSEKPVLKLEPPAPWKFLSVAAAVLLVLTVGIVALQMQPMQRSRDMAMKSNVQSNAPSQKREREVAAEAAGVTAGLAVVTENEVRGRGVHSSSSSSGGSGGIGYAGTTTSTSTSGGGSPGPQSFGLTNESAVANKEHYFKGKNAPAPAATPAAGLMPAQQRVEAGRKLAKVEESSRSNDRTLALKQAERATAAKPKADEHRDATVLALIQPVDTPTQEDYNTIQENAFKRVMQDPLSTFSIDVDTASYSNIRRFLKQNTLPPADAIRIEEMVNYFNYNYPQPADAHPFAVNVEIATCPWKPEHRLARVGLKGKEVDINKRPASNLVFLIDVSGSMNSPNRLPLVKDGLKLMVEKLNENDRVAIVVYAGAAGLVLPPTTGDRKAEIIGALDRLNAGGSTNGGQGIQLAYDTAVANYIQGGINRVMLCTDGDWNVGVTNRGDLIKLIEEKAKSNVFLTVLGYGMGNYKDGMLEQVADKGNGAYAYIDDLKEAQKVLVEQMSGTLMTIAKDVKIQVEFNPAQVSAYRLVGYENRVMANEDFNNDKKDAGDIGAGHTVTALYELIPVGKQSDVPLVDPLKYQGPSSTTAAADSGEVMTVKLRYKQPEGQTSQLIEVPAKDEGTKYGKASKEFKFAAAVASFGLLLRKSEYKGNATFDSIIELAAEVKATDKSGRGAEFVELVQIAKTLAKP